ncbi:ABC transporter substrate-binding protein [Lentzea tibetensis]|uniref:ABC transporter substrate-binding protein n=1 Tax=Lentzea tibetensis TaxID=2591470 RepID=A0A563F0I5_9PSEU|nr:urea ABC transporter substrate-binding protein [Lentzea tibetensis]TWP53429.1 ABC transporter substrate-binding protein [Lentzea tibetensis]
MRRALTALATGVAVVAALTYAAHTTDVHAESPIKVGVLHSGTGSVAASEQPITDATILAIEEINATGGLLGRQVEPVVVDGKSDWPTHRDEAERLITREHVSAIFGGYTSASRRIMVPIVEKHRNLLLYPTFYEGMESSPHVVYTGAAPNQFITPAIRWFLDNRGKSFFIAGSDYIFPRAAGEVIKNQLGYLGGKVVGEAYVPLGASDVDPIVEQITRAKPDVIVNILVGEINQPFYQRLRDAGINPKQTPTLALVIGEAELRTMPTDQMAGDYVAMNYFQSIETPENKRFVESFRKRFGPDRVVSDPMEAAYVSVQLWAQAVRKADTADPVAVRDAVKGQRLAAPQGEVFVDEENLHLWKAARIGRIRRDGQIEIIWTTETLVHPVPYSIYRTKREWDDLLTALYDGWGGSWAAPSP